MPGPRSIPDVLKGEPITEADGRAWGFAGRSLRRAGFRQPHKGVFVWRELPDSAETQYDAAQLTMNRIALASHQTAAQLHGLPAPTPRKPHFWMPEGEKGKHDRGLRGHYYKYAEVPDHRMVSGRRVTSVGKTFIDLATEVGLFDLVAFGDAAIQHTDGDLERLRDLASERGRRHIRKARRAVELIRPRVDSAPESHLRLLILFAGLPEPVTGRPAYDAVGEWIATPDLSYPDIRLAIEYDGRHHVEDARQWTRDVDRNRLLVNNGWKVLVVLADHLYRRPYLLLDQIHGDLRERGHPGAPEQLDHVPTNPFP